MSDFLVYFNFQPSEVLNENFCIADWDSCGTHRWVGPVRPSYCGSRAGSCGRTGRDGCRGPPRTRAVPPTTRRLPSHFRWTVYRASSASLPPTHRSHGAVPPENTHMVHQQLRKGAIFLISQMKNGYKL